MAAKNWSDLPTELLQLIAERLGLIDLLSFRAVCKDWTSASSTASAEIEALPNRQPWFLSYGENNSQCTLVTEYFTTYSITIPELDGATCLGSSHGWLLLFREDEGSMFFFCPFSRAEIDLPVPGKLPRRVISDHVAIFSSPPTSKDCVVCINSKTSERKMDLYVIHRGATAWTQHEVEVEASPNKISCAAYHNGAFYFFDNFNTKRFVRFSIENRRLSRETAEGPEAARENFVPLRFCSIQEMNNINARFLLGMKESLPRSICGTTTSCDGVQIMVPYCWWNAGEPGCYRLRGAWFQPRFHQIDQNQSW